ncbi:response regulator [Neglecta sp. X4]|uniref:GAF domain-containing hybrid sensor histidine kinase/response regulator n=1 Tax=unclassified Neglectibacter TaxID=2632164 RepID=UPI0013701E06|nr:MULTISPECIES: GAF domain-containing hybrid sensor histidine kinase/response regulator [unclassified Neglectibacter]NBI17954.1 response regulator [Neglectibacter sp. 59]NBJ73679.1 response regulator [Neglectibacter sp. X4]NCE81414.1 response regulator [Neglectibacter sp. X58]
MDYSGELLERALEAHEQHSGMRSVQNLEAVINEGLRVALLEETPDQSLQVLLEHLGNALSGERTYIFEQNESGCDDNTYEWVAEGVEPEKDSLQNVPPEVCASWYRKFRVGKHIVIGSLEDIRETESLQYENLKRQGVHSLVVVPLYDGKKLIGFYGVDNPPVRSLEYASNMLQTAAYFIVSSLKRRNLVRELQKRSYNVFHALSMDYLGIYKVNFDTGECEVYRNSGQLEVDWAVNFQDGYAAAMERYISTYVVPRDRDRLRAVTDKGYVLARLKAKKKFSVRYQVEDCSSGLKHLEIHFSATEDTTAENCAIFAQRDVNALVEQEEKYKLEARQSLEDILEGARTGIWTIELEDGCPPRMYADRTMRILLGVPEEIEPEACYRHWFEGVDPDYVEMVEEAVREMLKSGRSEVVYPWNHPKLGKIYVRCGGVPDKTFKKPGVSLNGYHQDITETMVTRKKQEQSIMELLERVRQANSAKSEFLSHMSHDLRTPINGILGMLAILEKSQHDAQKQQECRKKIRVSTEHLLSLVNDVLQVSKLESGRPAAVEEPFDLHEALEDCIMILSPLAEEREIRLELEDSGLRHSRVIGNPLHLKQIMTNVIDNALRYNRPYGSVFVRAEETSFHDGTANCRFVIEDTGIGIGEDFKKHIFEPFTQEHQGARTNYNGVGLGMSIVKKLVDQMKGTVKIDSQVGKGSVVQITLPVRADEAGNGASADENWSMPENIAGMRVLLVEDNEINCEIVEYILRDAGVEVVTANNGKAAVDAFAGSEPEAFDCVLMDLMMPVMSGYEAARVIRSLGRSDAETVPIIALSANAFDEDIAMAKDAGMDEHLAKPVDLRKMFQAMSRLKG